MDFHLTNIEAAVLDLLLTLPETERFGLGMVAANPKLKKGTVYVLLGRLEKKMFVTSWTEGKLPQEYGKPRRFYRITLSGQEAFATWVSEYDSLVKSRGVALGQ